MVRKFYLIISFICYCSQFISAQQYMIQNVNPPNQSFIFNNEVQFESYMQTVSEPFNNWVYHVNADSLYGAELWKTDGDTCILVKDVWTDTNGIAVYQDGIQPYNFFEYGNYLYFMGNDTSAAFGYPDILWQTDGVDVWKASGLSNYFIQSNIIEYAGKMAFIAANSAGTYTDLVTYDGVSAVSYPITNYGYVGQTFLSELAGNLYFMGNLYNTSQNLFGVEYLFKFDGIGVNMLSGAVVNDFPFVSLPPQFYPSAEYMVKYNGNLYFSGFDSINGYELRNFDGNTISLVSDINPGAAHGTSYGFKVFQNKLYFYGNDGVNGYELWSYDGSSSQMVANLSQATCPPQPGQGFGCGGALMEVFNDKLYFVKDTGGVASQLWVYDGVNIDMVKDLFPNHDDFYNPDYLKVSGPYLYFRAIDSIRGQELWRFEDCEVQNTATTATTCEPRLNANGQVIVGEFIFTDTLTNSCGGDSVLTTHYTYQPINTVVILNNYVLTAQASGYDYQWLNCDNNQAIVNGTGQSYAPSQNGNYAVVLIDSESGCSDTSACFEVSGLGVNSEQLHGLQIYPNPNSGIFIIRGLDDGKYDDIEICNVSGQIVKANISIENAHIGVKLNHIANGLYFVRIKMVDNQIHTLKIMLTNN